MRQHEGTIRMAVVVLVTLVVNIVLDRAFDVPMLLRWGIALAVIIALTLAIEMVRKRSTPRRDRG